MNAISKLAVTLIPPLIALLMAGCNGPAANSDTTAGMNPAPTSLDGIIKGNIVPANDVIAKSTVLLYNKDIKKSLCTAILISDQFAITAAHCVENIRPESFILVFGPDVKTAMVARAVADTGTTATRQTLQQVKDNAYQGPQTDLRDVALIRYVGGLPKGFQPATLVPEALESVFKVGIPIVIAGYGNEIQEGGTIGTLRWKVVTLKNPAYSVSEMLLEQTKGGACNGDSGGPAFVYVGGKYYLWGVSSRGVDETGVNSGDCSKFVVYSNLMILMPGLQAMIR